jgi:WD40 repeat protein
LKHGLVPTLRGLKIRKTLAGFYPGPGMLQVWLTGGLAFVGLVAIGLAWYWHDRSAAAISERDALRAEHQAILDSRAAVLTGLARQQAALGDVTAARSLVLAALAGADGETVSADTVNALYDVVRQDRLRGVLSGHGGPIRQLSFSRDGSRLVSVGQDGSATLWRTDAGAEVAALRGPIVGLYPRLTARPPATAILDAWGRSLAMLDDSGEVRLWDLRTGRPFSNKINVEEPRAVGLCPDGSHFFAVTALGQTSGPVDGSTGEVQNAMPTPQVFESRDTMVAVANGPWWRVVRLRDIIDDRDGADLGRTGMDLSRLIAAPGHDRVELRDLCSGEVAAAIEGAGTTLPLLRAPRGSVPIFLTRDQARLAVRALSDGRILKTVENVDPSFTTVTFSEDGRWLAGYSSRLGVRVWDMTSGQPLVTYADSDNLGALRDLVFSPDGKLVVADVESHDGQSVMSWWVDAGGDRAAHFAVHPGDRFIGMVSDGSSSRFAFRIGTSLGLFGPLGDEVARWEDADPEVPALSLPTGRLVWALKDGSIRLWPTSIGNAATLRTSARGSVTALAVNGAGDELAVGYSDGLVALWSWSPFGEAALAPDGAGHWALSPGGTWAIAEGGGAGLTLIDLEDGTQGPAVPDALARARHITLGPKGRRAVATLADGSLVLTSFDTDPTVTPLGFEAHSPWAVFARSADRLAVTDRRRRAAVFDASDGDELWARDFPEDDARQYAMAGSSGPETTAIDLRLTADGDRVLVAHGDHVLLVDPGAGKVLVERDVAGYRPALSGFGADGRFAVLTGEASVTLVGVRSGEEVATVADRSAWPGYITVAPTATVLVAVEQDGQSLGLWDLTSGSKVATLPVSSDANLQTAFSPDGDRLAVVDDSRVVRIVDTADGEPMMRWEVASPVSALAFSPDGERVASADRNGVVQLRRLSDGRLDGSMASDLNGLVYRMTFAPDGRTLLLRAGDCLIWHGFAVFDLKERIRLLRVAPDDQASPDPDCARGRYGEIRYAGGGRRIAAVPADGGPAVLYDTWPGGPTADFATWVEATSLGAPEHLGATTMKLVRDLASHATDLQSDLMDDILPYQRDSLGHSASAAERGDYVSHLQLARQLERDSVSNPAGLLEAFVRFGLAARLANAAGDSAVARFASRRRGTLGRGLPPADVIRTYRSLVTGFH